ncbi:MAG: hypothetical protein DIU79_04245 [Actinobacteria bacterium]|nr:MAG: hypothetical protein DIU79_04245 [Actinomycetota bacterium]
MRLGVLDVGSNTVHLLVVDAYRDGYPWPVHSTKTRLRLAERVGPDGAIDAAGVDALVDTVAAARGAAERLGVAELRGVATSAVRDAANSREVVDRVRAATGVRLDILSGEEEARLTFLAARRWFGWSAGRLLALDIGGGSFELAVGLGEEPEVAVSLPLGAGRMAQRLRGDHARDGGDPTAEGVAESVPTEAAVARLRQQLVAAIAPVVPRLQEVGWHSVSASSRTFRTLARLAGAAPKRAGPWVRRTLTRAGLRQVISFIRHIPPARLARLDGVKRGQADQLLAGALVAEVAMSQLGVEVVEICPWALREGVLLRAASATRQLCHESGDITGHLG